MRVAKDLAFHVAGAFHQLFQIDFVLAESRLGFALGFGDFARQIFLFANGAHAATAATPGGFQHHRVADLLGHAFHLRKIIWQRLGGRNNRHTNRNRQIARGHLVAELTHGCRAWADEGNAGGIAGVDEFGAFRQKAVAWMDGVSARELSDADHFLDRQIALDRTHILGKMRTASDLVAFIRLEAVEGQLILFGPDGDRFYTELVGGAKYADCDLRTIGNENFRYLQNGLPRTL